MKDKQYILVYGIKNERRDVLERVAFAHEFGIRQIEDHELELKVAELLDGKVNEVPEDFVFEDKLGQDFEYMLFVNIHDEPLYKFLEELKSNGVYIPHKAVLTETNKSWPIYYLMNENKEEHKVMTLYGQLRKIMGIAVGLVDETGDPKLKEMLVEAEDYFHPREFEFEELKNIYNKLAKRINELLAQR